MAMLNEYDNVLIQRIAMRIALLCFLASIGSIQAQDAPASARSSGSDVAAAATFKATTRMVTVEVVARDHQGHAFQGLTADDFQIFEQIGWNKEKHPQKIVTFRTVSINEIAAHDKGKVEAGPGVYTNLVTMQKNPVPPTVLLVDGLNTEFTSQLQVHRQMIRMLASIPSDIPVAVFLLGRDLRLLQDFTTDPKLLQSALQKASSLDTSGVDQVDPRDDSESLSAFAETIPGARNVGAIQRFERDTYASGLDDRVRETLDALRAIARHVAGYPGRKNLLWISSSFPIAIDPGTAFGIEGMRNYGPQMQDVANELGLAKVAVYPLDPAGLGTQGVFKAGPQRGGTIFGGPGTTDAIDRDDQRILMRQQSMRVLAEQTGGQVCVNNNDLGDCVKKAVADGNSFYELSYYADSTHWNNEFHKITVKVGHPGIHIAYRQGYYARPERTDQKSAELELQQAACRDLLTATSVIVAARSLPPDNAGNIKYLMVIDPNTITFAHPGNGTHALNLQVAACTFDKAGKPLQMVQGGLAKNVTDQEYSTVMTQHGLLHTIVLPGNSTVFQVRLVVKDLPSGRFGSVNIPLAEPPAVVTFGSPSHASH